MGIHQRLHIRVKRNAKHNSESDEALVDQRLGGARVPMFAGAGVGFVEPAKLFVKTRNPGWCDGVWRAIECNVPRGT